VCPACQTPIQGRRDKGACSAKCRALLSRNWKAAQERTLKNLLRDVRRQAEMMAARIAEKLEDG
jgi:hypothetical protein